ncbi:UNKNOWN [Stylonychia lemnae]|uniref:Uncharacterized protein n=1 Tax=Stylonychia lemnae TaxID=5949 RepID=A0A078ACV7_STYLE|nr:UNKNOWN [Stylonychia lemnae]|eukprot:CDW78683.1 UNKNOWN [Stylonychia lemnae]
MNTDDKTQTQEFLIDDFLLPYDSINYNEQQLESPKNLNYFEQDNTHKGFQQSILDLERFHYFPVNIEIFTGNHNTCYLMSAFNDQMSQQNLSNNQGLSDQGLQQLAFNADKITYQDLDQSDLDDDDNKHTQVDCMSYSPPNEILTKIKEKQQKVKGLSTQEARKKLTRLRRIFFRG